MLSLFYLFFAITASNSFPGLGICEINLPFLFINIPDLSLF